MRGQHDLGGAPAGPVDTGSAPTAPWAKLITATVGALRERRVMTIDEMRRALEDLPEEAYDKAYFERWAEALCDLLEEKGIADRDEVRRRMAALRAALEAAP